MFCFSSGKDATDGGDGGGGSGSGDYVKVSFLFAYQLPKICFSCVRIVSFPPAFTRRY